MLSSNELKAVCSVAELTAELGLPKARFYQLQKMGVFPAPVYYVRTKRPFYRLDLRQECVKIRRTGIGRNGQPVLFYAARKGKSTTSSDRQDHEHEELAAILKRMGLAVSPGKIRKTVEVPYPDKLAQQPVDGKVIRELFRHFERRM